MALSPEQSNNNLLNNEPSRISPPKENESVDDDSGLSVSGNNSSCSSGSDGEAQVGQAPPQVGQAPPQVGQAPPQVHSTSSRRELSIKRQTIEAQYKSESLAKFIIASTLDPKNVKPNDEIEATLLRCTTAMVSKHEILFNSMMRKLQINNETAYMAFINVVNQLFEVEHEENSVSISWNRIIALYAFGGQLAMYCKQNNLRECEERIPLFLGRYAKETISSYVFQEGGWKKICEEYPAEDDIDKKIWKVLTWTALGLGIATAASFLASNH